MFRAITILLVMGLCHPTCGTSLLCTYMLEAAPAFFCTTIIWFAFISHSSFLLREDLSS